MKKFYCIILLFAAQSTFSLEPSKINLRVPTGLEPKQMVLGIQHRFYGNLENEFLGINAGANTGISLRYLIRSKLEMNGSLVRNQKEYTIGAGYAFFIPQIWFKSQVSVEFFNYEKLGLPDSVSTRRGNLFYSLALQSDPIINRIIPTINIAYDGYNQRLGLGAGIDFGFTFEIGPLEGMNIIGEYYPIINRDNDVNGSKNCFTAGLKFNTYGHHFLFLVGNTAEIGLRRFMLGANNNDLHLGFTIHRFIGF